MFSVRAAAAAKVTTPMLAVTRRAAPSRVRLLSRTRSTMESATWPAPDRSASGRRMANSSPPRRATRSVSRSDPRRSAATETITRPRVVPAGVVDLLEVVEVHEDEGAGGTRTGAARQVVLEGEVEPAAVRQAGEDVVVGEVSQLLLVLAALGHVDDVDEDDVLVALRRDDPARQRHVDLLAERTGDGPLAGDPVARPAHGLVEVSGDLVAVVGGEVTERGADDGVDPAPDHRRQRLVDLEDDPPQVEDRDAVRGVSDEALGARVGAAEVVEAAVLVGDVAQHEEGAVGVVGGAVGEGCGIDRHEPGLAGVHVVGLDDEAPDRLTGEGDQGGALPRREDGAVEAAAGRGDVGVEAARGAVLRHGEPAPGGVVVQDDAAVAVEHDERVGDRLGDDPQVLGLAARGPPGERDVGDEPVALPLRRREHEGEHRREEHERLERQGLTGDVADVAERPARGHEDEDERHDRGEGAVQRGERHGEAQAAPHEDGEGEEGERDGATRPEDEPEDEPGDDEDRERPRRGDVG